MSFAFRVLDDDYSGSLRTIKEISLNRGDVSVVAMGANPSTSVNVRARPNQAVGELALYQARLRALQLRGGPIDRDRHLRILNEAGRAVPAPRGIITRARAIANELRVRRR